MEEPKLWIANIIYGKAILGPNGKKEPPRQTVRLLRATSKEDAIDKLKIFWNDKMRSFRIVGYELNQIIE